MSHVNVIRAWKDEEYRLSLSEAERALLPNHPAGLIELTEADMSHIDGGTGNTIMDWEGGNGCTCCCPTRVTSAIWCCGGG